MTSLYPSLTVLLLFACLVAYEYIRYLRSDLRAKESELRITRDLLASMGGRPVSREPHADQQPQTSTITNQDTTSAVDGFRPMGIGPTAIMDRERRRTQKEAAEREPRFANPGVLTHRAPTAEEIAAAAREAADGEHLN